MELLHVPCIAGNVDLTDLALVDILNAVSQVRLGSLWLDLSATCTCTQPGMEAISKLKATKTLKKLHVGLECASMAIGENICWSPLAALIDMPSLTYISLNLRSARCGTKAAFDEVHPLMASCSCCDPPVIEKKDVLMPYCGVHYLWLAFVWASRVFNGGGGGGGGGNGAPKNSGGWGLGKGLN